MLYILQIARPTVLGLRGLVQGVCLLLFALHNGISFAAKRLPGDSPARKLWDRHWVYVVLSGVVLMGGIRLCLVFLGLQLIHMSTVHTIMSGAPVVVMCLSHRLLRNEPFTVIKGFSCTMLIVGIVLCFQPYKWITGDLVSCWSSLSLES